MIDEELQTMTTRGDYVGAREIVHRLLGDRALLEQSKETLARLYRQGDSFQRRFVVNGILEHLFERSGTEEVFGDWRNDPELEVAFSEAQQWGRHVAKKIAFLSRIAALCADELRGQGIEATVKEPEIGVDSIAIEMNAAGDDVSLVLDCDENLVDKIGSDTKSQIGLAKRACDRRLWKPDEYSPWQQWVHLTEESN